MMAQFVILFILTAHGGPEKKFWVYGKPAYVMDYDCEVSAQKVVDRVFKRATKYKIKGWARSSCYEVRADKA